jgi:hypothetical protein
MVRVYRERGHSLVEIAEALTVSTGCVHNDIVILVKSRMIRPRSGQRGRGFAPEPVRWWEEPPRPKVPIYVTSPTMAIWRRAVEHDADTRGVDCLRGDARDAVQAGDVEWIENGLDLIERAEQIIAMHRDTLRKARARARPLRSVPEDS